MNTPFSSDDLFDMGLEPIDPQSPFTPRLASVNDPVPPSYIHPDKLKSPIPVLPNFDIVPMPDIMTELEIDNQASVALCADALDNKTPLFVAVPLPGCLEHNHNGLDNRIQPYGVIAYVYDMDQDDTGVTHVLLKFGDRARFSGTDWVGDNPFFTHALLCPPEEPKKGKPSKKFIEDVESALTLFKVCLSLAGAASTTIADIMSRINSYVRLLDFICFHVPASNEVKYGLLRCDSLQQKADRLKQVLEEAIVGMRLKAEIIARTSMAISDQQRSNYLQNQLNAIKGELGESFDEGADVKELQERAREKKWPETVSAYFDKELKKLARYNISMPEYSIQYTYLDTLLNLPWNDFTPTDYTLENVSKILDRDHFGLEKVKRRIIEQMAVQKLRKDLKSPIICLVGPPGVGKTSLGKSIAEALGREYQRVALGGINDEAEIRGHRRTYVGAMAGRLVTALAKCKKGNPLIVLDEIDKMGKGMKGDPEQALLEVLDPEQNTAFHDNYVDIDYDLSPVFFLATANSLSDLSAPLLDRMEIIELHGYITAEKKEIAQRHLLSKTLLETGFEPGEIYFEDEAVEYIVESYTRETGVRQLEKKLASVLRKIACMKAEGRDYPRCVTKDLVRQYLGKEEIYRETYEDNSYSGVATGLAWTPAGGEILFIETSVSKGKGGKLALTGSLGEVMKESATIALEYLRSHAEFIGMDTAELKSHDVHVHVPEGAVPKDGPSAGITMVTSMASAFTRRKVRDKLAMTGEITLRGKVLPVGGIREKILAARRAGITDILMSTQNQKDIEEIPPKYITGLTFHYVDHVSKALSIALLDEKAEY